MGAELRPYPRMRDSGVEWLGEVPEHWEVRRLRSFADLVNGGTPSSQMPEYWGGDLLWITPSDLGALEGRHVWDSARRITWSGYEACGTSLAPAGSVAISIRAPIGHTAILGDTGCVNQGCRLLVPTDSVASTYLDYALDVARSELQSLGCGSTFLELSREALADFRISLPLLPEQHAIVRYLDDGDRRIRRHISATRRQITLLREYRTRLIADVVTGKLDVREVAAVLPEVAPVAGGSRVETIPTEPNLHPIEDDTLKEAIP